MRAGDDHIRAGDIEAARGALVDAVRSQPADVAHRLALAEVLIVLGDYERADTHLNAAQNLDVSFGVAVALTRQLVRAAMWRSETFEAGRPPELVTARTAAVDAGLAIILAMREGGAAPDEAGALPEVRGTVDGRAFAGWRDADDRTAGVLEIMTSTGNYVWVPLDQVRTLRFEPVKRLRDTIWRPAEIDVAEGPSGVVYLPVIYHASSSEQTSQHRLGRETDWIEGAATRGLGLRTWLIGDEALSPGEFTELTISP